MTLSNSEKNALRFYIGDVSGNDPFYGDSKAYVTLNSLFFPGIYSETARTGEGKLLNPHIIEDIPRLIGFYEALFSAFVKSEIENTQHTLRVERLSDYKLCHKKNMTVSMTSTSVSGFLNYYRDRRGIALMRFTLPRGSHCIDIEKCLDFYAKPEESEILLPPFMKLDIKEFPLSDYERDITDCDGKSPQISCCAKVCGIQKYNGIVPELPENGSQAAARLYSALNSGKSPENADIKLYSQWKKTLQYHLHKLLSDSIS